MISPGIEKDSYKIKVRRAYKLLEGNGKNFPKKYNLKILEASAQLKSI